MLVQRCLDMLVVVEDKEEDCEEDIEDTEVVLEDICWCDQAWEYQAEMICGQEMLDILTSESHWRIS